MFRPRQLLQGALLLVGTSQVSFAQRTPSEFFDQYGFNPSKLSSFYSSLDGLSKRPVDVLFLGDSLSRGYGLADPDTQAWPNQMGRSLQSRWNPPGIEGGRGFLPARYTWAAQQQPFWVTGGYPTQWQKYMQATGNAVLRLNGSLNSPLYLRWDGSEITSLEVIAYRMTQVASESDWVLFNDDQQFAGKIVTSRPTPPEIARRTVLGKQRLDPQSTSRLSIRAPHTGYLRLSGIVRYRDDENAGIRFQNLACSGNLLADTSGFNSYLQNREAGMVTPYTRDVFDANVTTFPHSKLVFLELGTNDQSTYGRTDLEAATLGHQLFRRGLFEYCRMLTNRDNDVVLVVMPAPGAGRESRYRMMVPNAVAEVARILPRVTRIDFDTAIGSVPRAFLPSGWDFGDQVHLTRVAHDYFAQVTERLLVAGRLHH
ncbi:MAG: SGNH/GDSL hydrolase family protein [Chthonomonas sp.]|nr:SGNH/GDSL hydrolase family protein [Chthonomonas sp.]